MTRELGRLARWLRLLGHDTVYAREGEESPSGLLIRTLREERTILTRDHRWGKKRGVRVIWIQSDRVEGQLKEVFKLPEARPCKVKFFTRCLKCNALLESANKPKVASRVPPYVFETVKTFKHCPRCDQIFWAGTHVALAQKFLEKTEG